MSTYSIDKPYLSIVIAGRNDNYGGDFDARLQNSLTWYYNKLEQAKLYAEIVLVNYNPLLNEKPLEDRIKVIPNSPYVRTRMITVDEQSHISYHNEEKRKKLPFYEFIAKNIGIRRAKGEYILSTNADIVVPYSIIRHMATMNLKPYKYYRASRADFKGFESSILKPEEFIDTCRRNTFKIFMKGFSYDIDGTKFDKELLWLKAYNYFRLKYNLFKATFPVFMNKYSIPFISHNAEFKYHCQGSGDFMLMHNSKWQQLYGNPENTKVSTHADSWIVIMAAAAGLREHVFYSPVFHQHHERRFDWVDINKDPFFREEYERFEKAALYMLATQKPIIENDADWGYGTHPFNEVIL